MSYPIGTTNFLKILNVAPASLNLRGLVKLSEMGDVEGPVDLVKSGGCYGAGEF